MTKLSLYSWSGYGFLFATLVGWEKYGFKDYRVQGLFILAACLLMVDVVKYYRDMYRTHKAKKK